MTASPNKANYSHNPGPHIIPIDYESLDKMDEPPGYKPWDVYGMFLLSVAAQQTPMVMNFWMTAPDHVLQIKDVVFKKIDGIELGLDVYQSNDDPNPRPLILIIH